MAFYKEVKKEQQQNQQQQEQQKNESPPTTPTWAAVAATLSPTSKTRSKLEATSAKNIVKIIPLFEREKKSESKNLTFDRIVVSPTHFNNSKFSGYVTIEDAEVIRSAIGIKNVDFHGTSFERLPSGELSITFRLQREMDEQTIKGELNSNFWFEKRSRDGNLNIVRGSVIYPFFAECDIDNNNENNNYNNNNKDSKEVRTDQTRRRCRIHVT